MLSEVSTLRSAKSKAQALQIHTNRLNFIRNSAYSI